MGRETVSTRTRIILRNTMGGTWTGRLAIVQLTTYAGKALKGAIPKSKLTSKREKLLALAEKLPQGFELLLFQEPRRTRRNRSLYWSEVEKR